jgi:hypothetical protein
VVGRDDGPSLVYIDRDMVHEGSFHAFAELRRRGLTQGYTPFEGLELRGKVRSTYLRGRLVYRDGKIVGAPQGRHLHRACQGREWRRRLAAPHSGPSSPTCA